VADLHKLAQLIRERTLIDNQIAVLVGRPAERGHTGEYIAAAIFGIELHPSATHKGSDGQFTSGPLAGRTVNVKWYNRFASLLDINPLGVPDYYLVLTGPKGSAVSSRGLTNPWVIDYVFLLNASQVIADLTARGVVIGVASSVRTHLWTAAELYPVQNNNSLILTDEQRTLLALFASQSPT